MRHLTKWFIIAFAGVTILFASCVDQIKFGDSFLEKPPTTNDLNQDSIFGKADYAMHFYGMLIQNFIMACLITGVVMMKRK